MHHRRRVSLRPCEFGDTPYLIPRNDSETTGSTECPKFAK